MLARAKVKLSKAISLIDIFLFAVLFLMIYGLVGVAQEWAGPYRPKTEISLSGWALVRYSIFSLVRVTVAYLLSLVFTLTYGYAAAKSRRWEKVLIPVLDILQSVPVLGFMPGLVLALVHLFPNSNLGLELAAIVMIFTGEGWNMVFSFYSSVRAVPQELGELTKLCRMRKIDVLRTVELPFAMNGLIWNSMLSMAGGWFFLMTIESFSLGDKDFRLPGIGSYMAVAYEARDTKAIVLGMLVMFLLIIIVDRCVWAPLVSWSERFRFDVDSHARPSRSAVLQFLRKSDLLAAYYNVLESIGKRIDYLIYLGRKRWFERSAKIPAIRLLRKVLITLLGALLMVFIYRGVRGVMLLVGGISIGSWLLFMRDTLLTFLRVMIATALGSLWAIPLGVFIGTNRKWCERLQPVVQIVSSFPAPMLFPMLTFLFLKVGLGMELGAIVLMIFASQWYILFNVISGASLIPSQMFELAHVFHLSGRHYWKAIILPAIFPSLVNGWITAAGGAWNASIVSEFVLYKGETLMATGIGASISRAAQAADYPALAGGIFVMVITVVLLNRFVWGSLYKLAETRFRLEY